MGACLAVLVKFPRPGRVKSRLATDIGAEHAADIQKGMLLDILDRFCRIPNLVLAIVFPFDEKPHPFLDLCRHARIPSDRILLLQGIGDMNKDIVHAHRTLLTRFRKVVMMGADIPHYASTQLGEMLSALDEVDIAYHPNPDDGCCPHGLRRFGDLWTGNDSRDPGYILRWTELATAQSLSSRALSSIFDVDRLDDLVRLENEFADHCPHTMRAIRALHAQTR